MGVKFKKGNSKIIIKNYVQLSELFMVDRYGSVSTNFAQEVRNRAQKKRTFIEIQSKVSLDVEPTFNSGILNPRFAVEMPTGQQNKHRFPGLKPSKSENMLTLNKSAPDPRVKFDDLQAQKSPHSRRPRDSMAQPAHKHRKNVWAANIFNRLP